MKKFLILFLFIICGNVFADSDLNIMPVMPIFEEIDSLKSTTTSTSSWESVSLPAGTRKVRVYSATQMEVNFNATANSKEKLVFGNLEYVDFFPSTGAGAKTMYYKAVSTTGNIYFIYEGDL